MRPDDPETQGFMTFNRTYLKNSISIVIFSSFLIAVFAPFEFYITNKEYFFFSGTELLPFAVLLFLVLMCAGVIVSFMLSHFDMRISVPIVCTFMGIFLALYIIGNFVVIDYGAMDGRLPIWEDHRTQGTIQVVIMVICPAVLLVLSLIPRTRDIVYRVSGWIALWITAIMVVTLLTLLILHGIKKDAEYTVTTAEEFNMSPEQNVIVLILDTYDAKLFNEMLDEDYEHYASLLSDFTYFPDTSAMYTATDLAVPHIVTGVTYKNDMKYGEYLNVSYSESPLFKYLQQNDYSSGLYTVCRMPQSDVSKQFRNVKCIKKTVSSHRTLAKYMYRFLGFKYLPQPLKKYFWFYPEEMNFDLECAANESISLFYDNNFSVDDSIDTMTVSNPGKTFSLYHAEGVHAPFSITSDFSPSNGTTSIEEEARGVMHIVKHLLDKLKDNDVYDNSAIIIMADHGYFDERSNPLFLIKGCNEKHDFVCSDRPVSYEYLQKTFINLCEGESAEESVKDDESNRKTRFFLSYSWDKDLKDSDYASTITEYLIPGHVCDTEQYIEIESYDAPQ